MSNTIRLMIAKREAEIRLEGMDQNDIFRSAYEDFLAEVDSWIAMYDECENGSQKYFGRKCFRLP